MFAISVSFQFLASIEHIRIQKRYWYILCKINLAIVFVCVRFTKSGFYGKIIASRYMHRSLEKEFLVKQSRIINRSVCTKVASVLKTSGRKGHFWSYAGTKIIMKRLFCHHNKEKTKIVEKMNVLREKSLQILKFLTFSFDFTLSSKNRCF